MVEAENNSSLIKWDNGLEGTDRYVGIMILPSPVGPIMEIFANENIKPAIVEALKHGRVHVAGPEDADSIGFMEGTVRIAGNQRDGRLAVGVTEQALISRSIDVFDQVFNVLKREGYADNVAVIREELRTLIPEMIAVQCDLPGEQRGQNIR